MDKKDLNTPTIMYKYFVFSVVALAVFFVFVPEMTQAQEKVAISVFIREGCVHCDAEKRFLTELQKELPQLEAHYYDLGQADNQQLFKNVTEQYKLVKATPITLVRGIIFQGFSDADTTGKEIRNTAINGKGDNVIFEQIINNDVKATVFSGLGGVCESGDEFCTSEGQPLIIKVPLTGWTLDLGQFSLGAMALVLGLVDGFNPCALWVLVMFLIILSQLGSRRRMFQYAGLFIVAEAIMYYLILNVWLTAWNFVGLNSYAIPLVAVLAIGSGIYFLYKFATFKPVCAVAGAEQRKKISARVKELASNPLTLGVALGILGLAFSVNIFEFACSIGIPQTFTKILELNALGWLKQQWYTLLYIVMYMIDDVIVLGLAVYSIDKIGITQKYSKWSSLVGGILMIILGIIFLVKPTLLIF